jgi:hypothetical protein
MMAFRAKPNDIKRLRIVPVMGVHLLIAAEQARQFLYDSVPDSMAKRGLRDVGVGVFFTPPLGDPPSKSLAFWSLSALSVIFAHCRVSPSAALDAALSALFALSDRAADT